MLQQDQVTADPAMVVGCTLSDLQLIRFTALTHSKNDIYITDSFFPLSFVDCKITLFVGVCMTPVPQSGSIQVFH